MNPSTGPLNTPSSFIKPSLHLLLLLNQLIFLPSATKCAKVMFLQVFVCPHGGGHAWQGGMCGGGMHGSGTCVTGRACIWEACMAGGRE